MITSRDTRSVVYNYNPNIIYSSLRMLGKGHVRKDLSRPVNDLGARELYLRRGASPKTR